ncbi:hypothetical protein P168DRAFT_115348 [Aspergillus campestris IBT 28561]|uniref:Uncharacterized protein n=1 Tax=Aspergillus campestris (strain IBT 28561) TaxID=1392248 RepID=A0A2I1D9M6_ASPC2|nr:uncharacterized protein P168DRAFT_115348 [Aspergillus campestris IBT 28561]PKY06579.1 hypothetical protein P168DRAFT_115348 [Aspergillus campestris IBT 28561]
MAEVVGSRPLPRQSNHRGDPCVVWTEYFRYSHDQRPPSRIQCQCTRNCSSLPFISSAPSLLQTELYSRHQRNNSLIYDRSRNLPSTPLLRYDQGKVSKTPVPLTSQLQSLPNPTRIQYPHQQPPAESNPSSETITGLPGPQGRNRLVGRAKAQTRRI